MNNLLEQTLGEIVAKDYRIATIFEQKGLDFCCNGHLTLKEACTNHQIQEAEILTAIQSLPTNQSPEMAFHTWPLDLLADYIEKKHHRYVENQIPIIQGYLEKICRVHGNQHPELNEIKLLFLQSAAELSAHMKKEELLLFPYIRKLVQHKESSQPKPQASFANIQNPIQVMMNEHSSEGKRFDKIALLSHEYTVPADGCTSYRICFAQLKDFEKDLHIHIHLENNILFPKAMELEKAFLSSVV